MFDYERANTHLSVFTNGHCWRPRARETMALAPIEHESKLQRDNVAYVTVPHRSIQFMSSLRIPVNGTVVVLRTVTFQLWCLDHYEITIAPIETGDSGETSEETLTCKWRLHIECVYILSCLSKLKYISVTK